VTPWLLAGAGWLLAALLAALLIGAAMRRRDHRSPEWLASHGHHVTLLPSGEGAHHPSCWCLMEGHTPAGTELPVKMPTRGPRRSPSGQARGR